MGKSCEDKHIDDRALYQAFINTFNVLLRYKANQFRSIIENAESIEEFDMDLFFRIIEKMVVFEGGKIIVTLLDGTEIECEID